ncbi:hypothetical protein SDC9_171255 [bioreactor metagenome]|uniref:Uncharacterized protein n=1 Tax=bioreactor metagenome TaxID=1076179 RepID=A0A645GCY5_9ZZZZ
MHLINSQGPTALVRALAFHQAPAQGFAGAVGKGETDVLVCILLLVPCQQGAHLIVGGVEIDDSVEETMFFRPFGLELCDLCGTGGKIEDAQALSKGFQFALRKDGGDLGRRTESGQVFHQEWIAYLDEALDCRAEVADEREGLRLLLCLQDIKDIHPGLCQVDVGEADVIEGGEHLGDGEGIGKLSEEGCWDDTHPIGEPLQLRKGILLDFDGIVWADGHALAAVDAELC